MCDMVTKEAMVNSDKMCHYQICRPWRLVNKTYIAGHYQVCILEGGCTSISISAMCDMVTKEAMVPSDKM